MAAMLFPACRHKDVRLHADAIQDRKAVPVLDAKQVTTLISDSGVTRYRISADRWLIYDKADTPHWEFPQGVYLEKFNLQLQPDAFLQADYAYYNERDQQWILRGHVHAKNLAGEEFESPEMIWNQKDETIHSDSSIVITKQQSVIRGVGFRSNNDMSQYTILSPSGVFPIKE